MNGMTITDRYAPDADVVLFNGDCLDLLRAMPNGAVQLIVTSPPYNLGKPYESKLRIDEYVEQQRAVITECVRVVHEGGSICWQIGNYVSNGEIIPLDVLLYPLFASLGMRLRNRIIWHFGHGLHSSKRFSGRYEVILWFSKGDDYTFNLDAVRVPQKYPTKKYFKGPKRGMLSGNPLGKNPTDIWEIPNVKANHIEKTLHPCQFPVELVERLVLALTNGEDVVLDPFMGTGSTTIAALMHGRRSIGAELSAEYYKIAISRLRLGEEGHLRVRPLERPVYEPNGQGSSVPPKYVRLSRNPGQLRLLELRAAYLHRQGSLGG